MNMKDDGIVCELLNVGLPRAKKKLFQKPQERTDLILIRICSRVI